MNEVVHDEQYNDYQIRDRDEKEQIAEEINRALLSIARLHIHIVAGTADDFGVGFDTERYGLISVRWLQHQHRPNEVDLYLKMSGPIRTALRLPKHELLIAHAQLHEAWHGHSPAWEAVKKNIRHNGVDQTIVAVHAPWIEVNRIAFFEHPVWELRKRRDALTGFITTMLLDAAANTNP